ncbi:MAG: hypothetical protein ER33_07125 [Cyanobium sp. CACIAM 14]|nr:MAG: hypothetical protein ER33_07125 [Cyanobium sp. CACIAM 14]
MLHHMSLPARDPHSVARVLAELTDGQFFDFPIAPGAYMVNGCDPHGTALEILPDDRVWLPGPHEVDVGVRESSGPCSGFHVALSVPVSRERIEEVGAREGWLVRLCDRGPFQVIELWVENRFMVELLTAAMVPAYLAFMKPETYGAWLAEVQRSGAVLQAAH